MADDAKTADLAKQIYQDLLDRIGASYWENDFAAFSRMIHVPHQISSFGPVVPIDTQEDLRSVFDGIRNYFERASVTLYDRNCVAARFKENGSICGMHETRILSGSQIIEPPYPVKSLLREIDGAWMVCSSDNAFDPDRGVGHVFNQYGQRKPAKAASSGNQSSKDQ